MLRQAELVVVFFVGYMGLESSGFNMWNRLVGLVVKASASRAEDPACAQSFFGVESYQ